MAKYSWNSSGCSFSAVSVSGEDDALLLQVLADLVVHDLRLILRGDAGDQALLLRLGDAELVVGALDVGGQVVPARRLLLGRPDEVLDVLEVDAGQVRAPVGHRLAAEQLQALQPQVQHPFRLVLPGRDVPHDLLGQAAARARAGRVGVGPAELVSIQALEFGVRGRGHIPEPPGLLVVVVIVRVWTSAGAVTCVVQIPSPCAIVARRCTGVPSSLANASVSASHNCGNSAATCATGQWCWQSCSPPSGPSAGALVAEAA